MSDPDEPTGADDDVFDSPDDDESPGPPPGWLSAVGQMTAAVLAVIGIVVLFIGVAALLRRLLP
jgi:hypothetical protein